MPVDVRPWYATRQQVAARFGVAATSYSNRKIDEALEAFSRLHEKKCQRPGGLFPSLRTISLDWPDINQPTSWRLWLAPDHAISIVSLTSGGQTITGSLLATGDGTTSDGPPYNQIQLDRAGSDFLTAGSTPQRSVAATLWMGYRDDQRSAGTLAAAISSTSATTCTVSDSTLSGVGDQLIIDSERLVVTDCALTTTSQTITGNIAADKAVTTVPVSSGAAFSYGEVITVDAERMKIVDISGDNLIVIRAWDASVLAAHTSGATVYAPRLLTVARGTQGTTAATHAQGAAIARWKPPGESTTLVLAEVINELHQEAAGFARQTGGGADGEASRELSVRGLRDLRAQVYSTELRRRGRLVSI
jgi:hypothetical protein